MDSSLFAGGGEMGARMREFDWSRTPLGPSERWPQSLKTCIRIILTSQQPMFVWWGERLINLYNDAYRAILGGKHPRALARPASAVWRETWAEVGARAEQAMRSNEGTYDEALLLIMERNGYPEETYYTFSYSPVPGDGGDTGGILCANTEDTRGIVFERQIVLLRDLAAVAADARTRQEACELSARCLSANRRDPPFAMVYIADRERGNAVLAGTTGIEPEHRDGIFKRFYQAHDHRGGMGLGRYISAQIVSLHGGELTAEFPDDGGTCIVARLPVSRERGAATAGSEARV